MTPIRRQYLKIKNAHPDAILLFRMGDFYETFDDDAVLAAKELEITLTSRSMGKGLRVPLAGVPAHSLDNYLARLIKKGHKVAICEQLSDPAASKGLVDRDVVRVITPGTVLESSILDQKTNNYLAAVAEGVGRVGLAYVDISTGEFSATELASHELLLELERIDAAEVLVSDWEEPPSWTNSGSNGAGLKFELTPVESKSFQTDESRQALLSHFGIFTLESFGCEGMDLAVAAAGAIVGYLARTQKAAKLQLSNLAIYSTGSFMALDSQTRRNLELFAAGRDESKELSLLAALDRTKTPMGGRLLRQWLGQPLLDLPELEQRLDAVDHYYQDGLKRVATISSLARVADLERIVGRIVSGAVLPRELIALKDGLGALPSLREPLDGPNLDWLLAQLSPLPDVCCLIQDSIAPDPVGVVGDGNVINPGFSPEMDELKSASSNARQFIAGLEQRERERTGIKGLKVGYNQVFGYYIEVSKSNIDNVPDDYIRRQTLTNAERYIVPELKEYESLVLNARERLEEAERAVYRRVCAQLAESAAAISRAAGAIARIDVFSGLASAAVENSYVRPSLDLGAAIKIKNGRHPVVERVLDTGAYVPNDLNLANDDTRVMVLTGPNMAGKSTYIRQAAIITLMAQIGCFVPASEAAIGLVDRIFTRVGLQDDLATGQSTFMVEMVETAAILSQATPRSLVILDEIGRGTSTYDGLSIARSVIEHIHNDPRLGCKTLFATHYHELTGLAAILPGVRNYSVAVTEEGSKVVFLHQIVPGGADKSYGVHVAQLAGLPQGVINRAWEVLAELEDQSEENGRRRSRRHGQPKGEPAQQMPLFSGDQKLQGLLQELDIPNLTPIQAINKLYELQERARDQA
ncbi:MAG: DNA mismatch repair protein MutS [SAR202 cluster bacterium Io17-Chloro-G6]|nr:MAG: DNA mismatch repair protein MutS [SAR202 cluster bacterium Io17-Chloro-G6]